MASSEDIIEKDNKYILQGYKRTNLVLVEGKGTILKDLSGKEYIDCFSGIAVANVGHAPERLAKIAYEQMMKLNHVSGVYYTLPQTLLAEKLALITPSDLQRTYFCSSGTESVENAVKIAKKYAVAREIPGAGMISVELSFHGRYGHALALTGQSKYKKGFSNYPYVPGIVHAPAPYAYRSKCDQDDFGESTAKEVEEIIERRTTGDIAAFIIEPILGEGGIIVPPDTYFPMLVKILKDHDIPLIIDEVQTGFGRTGKLFASEYWSLNPHIMTLAKGLGSGIPIGAVITNENVNSAIKYGDMFSTFGGNPIATAIALENIKMIEEMKLVENTYEVGKIFMEGLLDMMKNRKIIGDVRGKGLMIGIELIKDKHSKIPAKSETVEIKNSLQSEGIIMGYGGFYGNVLRLQPPLVITEEQAKEVLTKLDKIFTQY